MSEIKITDILSQNELNRYYIDLIFSDKELFKKVFSKPILLNVLFTKKTNKIL